MVWVSVLLQGFLLINREWKFTLDLKLHRLLVLEELLLRLLGLLVLKLCHILLNVLSFSGLLSLDWRSGQACFTSLAAFAS